MLQKLFNRQQLTHLCVVAVAVIFLLLPFTTPVAIWLGSHLGHADAFKIWKEVAMVLVAALIVITGGYKALANIQEKGLKVLVWLIATYIGWTLLLGLFTTAVLDQVNWEAFLYAVIVNLRFLVFFMLCWLVAHYSPQLKDNWRRLLFIPAAVVVIFGLLQAWVLPPNILEHIGYGPDTTAAFQTVDQHPDYARVQSTLRGPNPLGAYLIIIITALLLGLRKRQRTQIGLLAGSLVVLFYSYSRSAWLGVAAAVAALAFVAVNNGRLRRSLAIIGVVGVLLLGGAIYVGRDNQFVQKTVFHTDETSLSPQSSNELRAGALEQGLRDIVHEPLGRGPGSAGPASFRNDGQPARIAENYYLQIGQEVGLVGLALFVAINATVAVLLWRQRTSPLAKVLLASLAGITVVAMVSHAWADETLSILWWGLAGISLATLPPNTKPKITPASKAKIQR